MKKNFKIIRTLIVMLAVLLTIAAIRPFGTERSGDNGMDTKGEEKAPIDFEKPETLLQLEGRCAVGSVQLEHLEGQLPPELPDSWHVSARINACNGIGWENGLYALILTGGDPQNVQDLEYSYFLADESTLILIKGGGYFANSIIRAFWKQARSKGNTMTRFRLHTLEGNYIDLKALHLLEDMQEVFVQDHYMTLYAESLGLKRVPVAILRTAQEQKLIINYHRCPEGLDQLRGNLPEKAERIEVQ